MRLEGLYTALITPFLHDMLDENGLIELIHTQLAAQVEGLVFLGTTGEAPTLTEKEAWRVVEIGAREVQGSASIIVGTGTNCTATTIEKTKRAKDTGADVALIINPYYNCPTQEGLIKHFESILEHTDLPIILYNHPKRTGVNLEISTIKQLSKHEKIIGLKEANTDPNHLKALLAFIKESPFNFSLLSGCDEKIYDWIPMGFQGVVSVFSNAFPLAMKNLVWALLQHNKELSKELYSKWFPLIDFCSLETNPTPIKALLNELGLPAGEPRLPLCPLSKKYLPKLREKLNQSQVELTCKN